MDIFGFSGVLSSGHRQLHHSDVILDGTNYIPWKLTIKRILDGTRVLCHVDGTSTTPVAPSIPDSIVSSEASALRIAFEQKMEKWAADDSTAKMIICQTVTLEIRTQIADLPTAHEMWHYLERRYCGSSQAQLYTLYQALTSLQQGEDTVDQFYSRYCALWRQIDALTPSYCAVHAAQILTCSESCSRRRSHDETRRMYEFIMRLRPEFEPTRAQLLHAPSAYSLDEAFAFVRAEETRLRASFTGGGSALAVSRPPLSSTSSSPRPLASLPASSRPPPRSKKIVTCHYCGILGHLERDCRKKQRGFPRNVPHGAPSSAPPLLPLPHTPQVHSVQTSLAPSTSLSATDQQLLAMFRQFQQSHLGDSTGHARSAQVPPSTPGSSCPLWLLDSGASLHMTPNATNLYNSRPPSLITRVCTADGTLLPVSSTGHLSSRDFSVPAVSHVPKLSMNLMSVSQLTDYDCHVIFDRTSCRVQDHSGKVIGAGRRHNGVYMLDTLHLPSSAEPIHQCHATVLSHHLWHHRLGHLCPSRMSSLVRLGVLGAVSPSSDVVCLGCKLGKQLQRPYPLSISQTTAPFELIHSDVWGPAPFVSKGGNRYYVIFVDDYTRFTWIYFMHHRSQLLSIYRSFVAMVHTQFATSVKIFRSDSGGEYTSQAFRSFLSSEGTLPQLSCPGAHPQNGVAERKHRHILETTRALLLGAFLPPHFWADAVSTAVYLINLQPSYQLHGRSPGECLHGTPPRYDHLRAFGCRCFVLLSPRERTKLTAQSVSCVFLGYSLEHKGYRCYDPVTRRIRISRDVTFDESTPFYASPSSTVSPSSSVPLSFLFPTHSSEDPSPMPSLPPPHPSSEIPTHSSLDPPSPSSIESPPVSSSSPLLPPAHPPIRLFYQRRDPTPTPPWQVNSDASPAIDPAPEVLSHSYSLRDRSTLCPPVRYASASTSLLDVFEPGTYREAVRSPEWRTAMAEELDALSRTHTWDLVPLPPHATPITCRWIYPLGFLFEREASIPCSDLWRSSRSRRMGIKDVFLCLLVAISVCSAAANSIHGCGGFIEASPALIKARKATDAKLDYSHITVELRTIDGLVKERTQCAPNGYYFIPVYDKGSFIIKVVGPDGWSWNPANVPVVVDSNGCNANADINFQFTGFMITGRIKGAVGGKSCSKKDGGPSDVKVQLLSPSDDVIASAFTSTTGDYSFVNIAPGKYKLHAFHPNLGIEVRGSAEVELGYGNAVVNDIFFVSGYDISGFVVAQGNPILGVHIYLHSNDVSKVPCPQGVGDALHQERALCHVISDADGKFTFSSIPCGVYELVPYYKGENTVFDVSPRSVVVSVEHCHVTIPEKFQVTGFSVGGRVVDGNNVGVEGAKVMVDGQPKAITDGQGFYKLDQVTSKHYSILAEKTHYKFRVLENFLVLPNLAFIDDIKAIHYDICGVVRTVTPNSKVKVALTHGPESVKPQMKLTNEDGSFCFEVPPGEYRLSALPIKSESSSSLIFSPPYVDVKVNSPVLNVEFFQAQVNIQGSVLCKENCQSISVSLVRLVGKGMEEKKTTIVDDKSGNFMFAKVFPGKYFLEVRHGSSLINPKEDDWCWDRSVINLDIGIEDIKGAVFMQKGYWIDIISTHNTDAYIRGPDSSHVDLLIKKGSQRICVESSGVHELHFVNSCIFFGSSSVEFDTKNPSPLYLTGEKYLVRGEIHFDSIIGLDESDLSESIILDVINKDGSIRDIIHPRLIPGGSGQQGRVYEYSVWSDLGGEFVFVPRDLRDTSEKKILFYPRQRHVSVSSDGCQSDISPIAGRFGLYISGSVSPALSGVDIKILALGDSSNAPLKEGDLALDTKTGEDGSFVAGPLYDDTSYKVEASMAGYHIKQVGPYSFTCQKLGQILVNIKDGKEHGEVFPSVLLSLSGEDGYRNNSISGPGGAFKFDNLFPGSFYLRPLLKEYSFSPAAVAIELGSGESKVVVFHATRVAYSATGSVSLLSGQPKEGIYVEARSESKGYYEEASTDPSGNFRLRGLHPDTTYTIKVAVKDPGVMGIERASPDAISINVGSEDIRGVDFIVFEQPDITILSGHVEGADLVTLQPHLSVEIRSASDPSNIESAFPLPLSFFFEIRDLPKGKHLVQLRSGLPSNVHKFETEVLEIDLEKQPQLHIGPLRYTFEEYHHKQDPTPAPVFPLIVGVCVIALFISMPRIKDLYSMAVGMTPIGSSPAPTKKAEVKKPFLRRRIY